jgi:hypothetical protein
MQSPGFNPQHCKKRKNSFSKENQENGREGEIKYDIFDILYELS